MNRLCQNANAYSGVISRFPKKIANRIDIRREPAAPRRIPAHGSQGFSLGEILRNVVDGGIIRRSHKPLETRQFRLQQSDGPRSGTLLEFHLRFLAGLKCIPGRTEAMANCCIKLIA